MFGAASIFDPFIPGAVTVYGITIATSVLAVDRRQIRFPRSKKKRIRRKWSKRAQNFFDFPRAFCNGSKMIICHPSVLEQMKDYARAWSGNA